MNGCLSTKTTNSTPISSRAKILGKMEDSSGIQPENKQKQRVREKLFDILLSLNVTQFERCMSCLLHALEYEDVRIMRKVNPQRRSHKGCNRHGGFDLLARSSSFSPSLTLVQAKQYRRPVSRRFVDELRGAMIREGAQHGLLITTSTFPQNAVASARENQLLPIALIDAERLLDLMFRFSLGVRCRQSKSGQNKSGQGQRRLHWRLDRRFFRELSAACNL